MIDYEVDLFDEVARAVKAEFPDVYASSEYVAAPPQFPALSFVEASNTTAESTLDSSGEEKYAQVTYEANVYSASRSAPKAEARRIAGIVDSFMTSSNFSRIYFGPVANAADPGIYRIVARYSGTVGKDGKR